MPPVTVVVSPLLIVKRGLIKMLFEVTWWTTQIIVKIQYLSLEYYLFEIFVTSIQNERKQAQEGNSRVRLEMTNKRPCDMYWYNVDTMSIRYRDNIDTFQYPKYPKIPKNTQKYQKIPKNTQKYPKTLKNTHIYSKILKNTQKYSKISESTLKYLKYLK